MGRHPSIKHTEAVQPKEKKGTPSPALKVTVQGQMYAKEARTTAVKHYEETFMIPLKFNDRPLQVVRRCLIHNRLSRTQSNYADVRKCELKGRAEKATAYGIPELLKRDVYKMDSEELRMFVLFRDLKLPVKRYDQHKKKWVVDYWLDSVEMIKRTPVDADLAEKAKLALQTSVKPIAEQERELQEEESNSGEDAEEGRSDDWEKLDA